MWPDNVKKVRSIQYPPTEDEVENGDEEQYLAVLAGYIFLLIWCLLFAVYVYFKCCIMLLLYWVICHGLSTCFMISKFIGKCNIDLYHRFVSTKIQRDHLVYQDEVEIWTLWTLENVPNIALRAYRGRKAENKPSFTSFYLSDQKHDYFWGKGYISSQWYPLSLHFHWLWFDF